MIGVFKGGERVMFRLFFAVCVILMRCLGLFLIYEGLTGIHSGLGMVFVGFLCALIFKQKGGG